MAQSRRHPQPYFTALQVILQRRLWIISLVSLGSVWFNIYCLQAAWQAYLVVLASGFWGLRDCWRLHRLHIFKQNLKHGNDELNPMLKEVNAWKIHRSEWRT